MKKRINSLLLSIILVMSFLMVGCGNNNTVNNESSNTTEAVTVETIPPTEATTEAPKPVDISISMIGDMLVHEGVYKSGLQADGTYNFDHLFTNIKADIAGSDIKIVNQETILGGTELGLSGYPTFNSPYELSDAIANAGFNVVLHATNHTMDKGLTGINNCWSYWSTNHPEIKVLGINDTEDDYNNIYVYEKNGFKVAILNYTYGLNGIPLPSSKPYVVNMMDSTHADKVIADIDKAKTMADMVVVCPHWGTEYVYSPDSFQTWWTNVFLSHGVDVVIGTHPHVIEPVEVLEGSDGHQMLIYYSLGNFVSNQDKSPRMIGAMAQLTLRKDPDGTSYVKEYGIVPLVTQKLFGPGLITTYKLSDYNDTLASQNKIKADAGCSDFSLKYCTDLCSQVFGDLYLNGGKVVLHE